VGSLETALQRSLIELALRTEVPDVSTLSDRCVHREPLRLGELGGELRLDEPSLDLRR
jgi:hypothetical protein